MLVSYHIGRLVLSSLCVGPFGAAGFWWCSFCRLKPAKLGIILFLILSFLEIRAERRQKSISVEFSFATVFAFKHHVSAA